MEDRIVTASGVSAAVSKAKAVIQQTLSSWFSHPGEEAPAAPASAGPPGLKDVQAALAALKNAGYSADHSAGAPEATVGQMYHQGPKPADFKSPALAGDLKGALAKRISALMPTSDQEMAKALDGLGLYAPASWGGPRDRAVAALVASWAQSNASPISLALQLAARELFGLTGGNLPPIGGGNEAAAIKLLEQYGPVLKDFLLAQWQASQADLLEHGIGNLTLYRVFRFPGAVPAWASQLHGGETIDAPDSRPLASWAFTSEGATTAATFAAGGKTVLVKTTVPASQALSYPRSGFGAYKEDEFVLLDAPGQWEVVSAT